MKIQIEITDEQHETLIAMARRASSTPEEVAKKILVRDIKVAESNSACHGPNFERLNRE